MGSWSYTYIKHRIEDAAKIPSHPHFVVLIFKTFSYMEAGYDRDDSPSSNSRKVIDYYVFEERILWERMIRDIYMEKQTNPSHEREEIAFFEAMGKGNVDIQINVQVKVK